MEIGVTLRNMGPQSDAATLRAGALRAESLGFESVWITDHIAIPPDDAEGSDGRYTDPLTTLAWLGGATERIRLGVGVGARAHGKPTVARRGRGLDGCGVPGGRGGSPSAR